MRTRSRGPGLGLPLAKKFVELHGGRIWLESEVGKGSKFNVHATAQIVKRVRVKVKE